MTTIINLYGGPGTGKSTSAAYVYFRLKYLGYNAELVREYVKDWAWEGRKFDSYVQYYFLGKQIRRETLLFNKAQFIVTDSPVLLSAYYANAHAPELVKTGIQSAVMGYYGQSALDGHIHEHVLLNRTKEYNPAGRFQTKDEAVKIDGELKTMLNDLKISYRISETFERDLDNLVSHILGLNNGNNNTNQPPNCS